MVREKDGATRLEHLEAAARLGSESARRALEGPEFPEALEYLWGWALELHGRSGVGMGGLAPLTYTTISDWARLTGREPTHQEVEALLTLDAVLLRPERSEESGG